MPTIPIEEWVTSANRPAPGQDWHVVGSGWSLGDFDHAQLDGRATIALNHAATLFRPTVHLWSDLQLADQYGRGKLVYRDPLPTIVTQPGSYDRLRIVGHPQLDDLTFALFRTFQKFRIAEPKPDQLIMIATVAAPAIHLAARLKARRIYLWGVDCCRPIDGTPYYADGREKPKDRRGVAGRGKTADGRDVLLDHRHRLMLDDLEWTRGHVRDRYGMTGIFVVGGVSQLPDNWSRVTRDEALRGDH